MAASARWLTTAEAARYLGCSVRLLENDRVNPQFGFPFIKIGPRMVRYDQRDLDKFMSRWKHWPDRKPRRRRRAEDPGQRCFQWPAA